MEEEDRKDRRVKDGRRLQQTLSGLEYTEDHELRNSITLRNQKRQGNNHPLKPPEWITGVDNWTLDPRAYIRFLRLTELQDNKIVPF